MTVSVTTSPEPATARAETVACDLDDVTAATLTSRMIAGDGAAYESLFRLRCGWVEDEASRRLGRRRDLKDDVAQEAWLRVARSPRQCDRAQSLEAWLRRVVRSAAVDILRNELARRCREDGVAMSRGETVTFLEDIEVLEEIRREAESIAGISEEERSLFELQARTGATVARLAAWLGIGRAALDSRLRRAAERARSARNPS